MNEDMRPIVEALATSAGRMVGTSGHEAARQYLIREMTARGLRSYGDAHDFELAFTIDGQSFCNLIGVLPGRDPALSPVLLAAHYDTCGPLPGADDNAAAISMLLTLIEPLRDAALERSVIVAFFDSEEPPYYLSESMGSNRFYHHQRVGEVHCAIVLDLVGHDVAVPFLEDVLFVTGVESDPGLESVFRGAASSVDGIRVLPTLTRYIGDMSDYSAFRIDSRPYLFLTCGEWQHYHAPSDTPEKLNYEKMAAIRDFLFEATKATCLSELLGPFEGYETLDTEIEFFTATAGPMLQQLGVELSTREEMDVLVTQLRSSLLDGGE